MSGFPTRPNRASFGPTYQNDKPVTDPQRELDASIMNLMAWQVAGLSLVGARGLLKCSVSGGAVSNDYQALAFDPNGSVSAIAFSYVSAGHYSFAFASQYPDENDTNRSLNLIGATVIPVNCGAPSGSHTGANNQPTLTDSTKTWVVNSLIGKVIYNTTDGSSGVISANTANTVTATLAGGAENDWDTGDDYVIIPPAYAGYVNLSSGYEGDIFFLSGGLLVDVDSFMLLLW